MQLRLTPGRGENVALTGGITIIDGCYNANPMSMRAALSDLADTAARTAATRRVAVLGDMLELGPDGRAYHVAVGQEANDAGVQLLVTVGALAAAIADDFEGDAVAVPDALQAAAIVPELLQAGDLVLVKGSLGVGLKVVCDTLATAAGVG